MFSFYGPLGKYKPGNMVSHGTKAREAILSIPHIAGGVYGTVGNHGQAIGSKITKKRLMMGAGGVAGAAGLYEGGKYAYRKHQASQGSGIPPTGSSY